MPTPQTGAKGRRRSRREALFILYQQDVLGLDGESALERSARSGGDIAPYTRRLVLGVDENRSALDASLEAHLTGWSVGRLGAVERNILRLAAFEIETIEDVESAVAINEAVDLAKRYGSHEAAGLVNGVLGSLAE